MIVPFTTFISFLLISQAWGLLTPYEFSTFLDKVCFPKDENQEPIHLVNGQENPLASTLENFISLAEKFELANPQKDLKDELFYFIRNYTYPNIEFTGSGGVVRWKPTDANYQEIDDMWEPDANLRKSFPQVEDPFTDAEKCSLYFMISHSIVRESRKVSKERAVVLILNNTSNNEWNNILYTDEDLYPQEQGVVSIQGTVEAVELGRVLTGMYVGLNKGRTVDIKDYNKIPNEVIPKLPRTMMDPLYALTIAEVVSISAWAAEINKRQRLAENGYWKSIPVGSDIDTGSVCPMVYRLKHDTSSAYSYSSMRGAADGLILGKVSESIESRKRDVKLSQVLRQYYSRGGFVEKIADLGDIRASFCNREYLLQKWEPMIKEEISLFIAVALQSYNDFESSITTAWGDYDQAKRAGVFQNREEVTKDYCGLSASTDAPEFLPLETPLDVIAVLDTESNDEKNFKKQQLIIGNLAKRLQLSYSGSRMTIFTDQKMYSNLLQRDETVYLRTIVDETYSQACAACSVTQASIGTYTRHPEHHVILGVHQYLAEKKENETKHNGVNGKVLILFNFEESVPPGRPSQQQIDVEKALRELHLNHRDVSIYALGKNKAVLKKYARSDESFVMSAFDSKEDDIAKELYEKLRTAPAKLQYPDCIEARSEKAAVFEDYITPNAIQHWSMPAEYFYKSIRLKFTFESPYGQVKVCHSRSTASPELQKTSCLDIKSGSPVHIEHSNPCKGFNQYNCAPFYFSLIGINATEGTDQNYCDDKNTENKCMTMDQMKFKVSHEGIRCSGSMGLMSAPLFLLFAFIASHLFSKLA